VRAIYAPLIFTKPVRHKASGNDAGTLAGKVAGGRDLQQPLPDYGAAEVTSNA